MVEIEEKSVSERICELIGYEAMVELCHGFGGQSWKIPERPPIRLREERIRTEFRLIMAAKRYPATMKTYQAIAELYDMSVSAVRRIVREK